VNGVKAYWPNAHLKCGADPQEITELLATLTNVTIVVCRFCGAFPLPRRLVGNEDRLESRRTGYWKSAVCWNVCHSWAVLCWCAQKYCCTWFWRRTKEWSCGKHVFLSTT